MKAFVTHGGLNSIYEVILTLESSIFVMGREHHMPSLWEVMHAQSVLHKGVLARRMPCLRKACHLAA